MFDLKNAVPSELSSIDPTVDRHPYFQFFSGNHSFQTNVPFSASTLSRFPSRISSEGLGILLEVSVVLHGKKATERLAVSDTTVQENNVTFPTDIKLAHHAVQRMIALAKQEGIQRRHVDKSQRKDGLRRPAK